MSLYALALYFWALVSIACKSVGLADSDGAADGIDIEYDIESVTDFELFPAFGNIASLEPLVDLPLVLRY
jgi:hypothetical protein